EGESAGGTSSVGSAIPPTQLYALIGGGAATLIVLVIMMVMLLRKPPTVQASGKDAIARITRQADGHVKEGRRLYAEKKYLDAKAGRALRDAEKRLSRDRSYVRCRAAP